MIIIEKVELNGRKFTHTYSDAYRIRQVETGNIYKITPEGATVVTTLPEGDISNYLYINNEYVYDPLLEPSPIEPEEGNVI